MNLKYFLLFIIFTTPLFPQITGYIRDSVTGKPIAGVNVTGKSTGTFTDETGCFSIAVQKGEALTISHIGYENISILASVAMEIKLHPLILKGKSHCPCRIKR